jgi:hypothetical protein
MSSPSLLVVLERGYRGTVEVQFSDLLYVCRGLHRQLGGLDLVLRGSAVTFAVDAAPVPPLRIAGHELRATADPRASLRGLLADGVRAWVDEEELGRRGLRTDRLVDGVESGAAAELAALWPDYERVWFL